MHSHAVTKHSQALDFIINSLIPKIHINHLGALPQLRYAFKQLLKLRALMLRARQIRRCQRFDKLGRHVMAMRNSPYRLINCVSKNDSLVLERDLAISKQD